MKFRKYIEYFVYISAVVLYLFFEGKELNRALGYLLMGCCFLASLEAFIMGIVKKRFDYGSVVITKDKSLPKYTLGLVSTFSFTVIFAFLLIYF